MSETAIIKTNTLKQRSARASPKQSFINRLHLFEIRLSIKEKAYFARRLSFLVKSGVPILDSLTILRKQTASRSKAGIYDHLIADVANGQFLSSSLAKFRSTFGNFAINIIKVGETSGNLSQNLNYLAEELRKKQIVKQKVVSALVYPIIVSFATVGLTVLLTVFIFPKIQPLFDSLHVALPFTTRILIFTSAILRQYGLLVTGLTSLFLAALAIVVTRFESAHYAFDRLMLKIPLAGEVIRAYNVTNACRTLGLLLKSGTTLLEASQITSETTDNRAFRSELANFGAAVVRGGRISTYLLSKPTPFPDMVGQMVAIGETTGNLSNTFTHLSEHYENELDDLIKNLSSSLEPLLMIAMGLIVGFIAVSVITPIYQITQNIRPS